MTLLPSQDGRDDSNVLHNMGASHSSQHRDGASSWVEHTDVSLDEYNSSRSKHRASAASWLERAEVSLDEYDILGALKYIQTAIDEDPKNIKVKTIINFLPLSVSILFILLLIYHFRVTFYELGSVS